MAKDIYTNTDASQLRLCWFYILVACSIRGGIASYMSNALLHFSRPIIKV